LFVRSKARYGFRNESAQDVAQRNLRADIAHCRARRMKDLVYVRVALTLVAQQLRFTISAPARAPGSVVDYAPSPCCAEFGG